VPPNKFIDERNVRSDDQREVMQEIARVGHCPFCPEALRAKLYHQQPFLREGTFWILTRSQWPYAHTQQHLFFILKTHATTLAELPQGAGEELFLLAAWAEREFKIPGGALAMRFGETDYSGASVNHLHAQIPVPDIDAPDYEPVRLKIGKSKK
jgi:ATP adenylyltransferase